MRAHIGEIDRLLFWTIRNTNTSAEIEKLDLNPQLVLQIYHEVEQHLRRLHKVIGIQFVLRDHRVQPEPLDTLIAQNTVSFKQLLARETILGLLGLADDHVAFLQWSRVVAKTE